MNIQIKKEKIYQRRKMRVKGKILGTLERPRLTVFKSNQHIYAQVIDDATGKTLASSSDFEIKGKMNKTEASVKVGEVLAKKALAKKVKRIIFDRNGFMYHGRIKAVAEGARKGGLVF
jgi:large subunit ribosomal protein L18